MYNNTAILFRFDFFNGPYSFNQQLGCYNLKKVCRTGMYESDSRDGLSSTKICQYCAVGSYSYGDENTCTICNPNLFDKCYSNFTSIKQGYWRDTLSENDEDIFNCQLNMDSCKSDNRQGIGNTLCSQGYIGEQCLTCDIKGITWNDSYGQIGQFQCAKCSSIEDNTVLTILPLCLSLLLFLFTLYSNSERMRKQVLREYLSKMNLVFIGTSFIRQSQAAVYIKILLFNFQMYLTTYYFVNFNKSDHSFHSTFYTFFNPLQNQSSSSYDCFLNQLFPHTESTGYLKLQIAVYFPLIINGIVFGVCMIVLLIRRKSLRSLVFIMAHSFSYTIIFEFLQQILQYSIQSFRCLQLTKDKQFLMIDTSINCSNQQWMDKMKYLSTPALSIYIVLVPLILFIYLFKNRHRLENVKVIRLLGFLYDEYKRKYYYWQFLKFLLSISLAVILQIVATQGILIGLIYIAILIMYGVLTMVCMPFQQRNLNRIEICSIGISILYLLSSLSIEIAYENEVKYETNKVSNKLVNVFYYSTLIVLLSFYLYMAILIVTSYFSLSIQKLQRYAIFNYLSTTFPNFFSKYDTAKLRMHLKVFRQQVNEIIIKRHNHSSHLIEFTTDIYHIQNQEDQSQSNE